MNSKKVFFIMSGFVPLAGLLTIATVYFGHAQLQNSTNRLVELKLEGRILEEKQLSLNKATKDISQNEDLEIIAKTVVPQEKDQARTVREIVNIASAAGVKISSITFPSSSLGQRQQTAPTNTEAPAGGNAEAATPTAPAASPLTQVKPVDGIQGVYQLELIVQSDTNAPVSYEKFIGFLDRLEQNRRTAQVSSITVQPSTKVNGTVTFNLTINVFIKP